MSYRHPYIILDLVYDRKAKIGVNSKPQINHLNYQLWEQNLHVGIKERQETSGIPDVIWFDKGTDRHKLTAGLNSHTHQNLAVQQQDLHRWDLCHSPLLSSTSPSARTFPLLSPAYHCKNPLMNNRPNAEQITTSTFQKLPVNYDSVFWMFELQL